MAITLVLCLSNGALGAGATGTREELVIRYSGPVTISPWRAADDARQQNSAAQRQWNHYAYSEPAPLYYCGWGYGCGYYGYSFANGYYGFYRPFFHHYPAGRYVP